MKTFNVILYRSYHVIFRLKRVLWIGLWIALCITSFGFISGCDKGVQSPRGFSLPEGEPDLGKLVFMEYQCLSCHSLTGYEDHSDDQIVKSELTIKVKLGGDVTRVKTYAELVTSVINPSHKIASAYDKKRVTNEDGSSKMRNYNDIMTVSELINLVAFLQPHYDLVPYQPHNYHNYHP